MYEHEARPQITKGGYNDLDDLWDTCGALAVGTNQRLHDWRIHSCPAGYRNRRGVNQSNFRT
jgi:hypothetical protein